MSTNDEKEATMARSPVVDIARADATDTDALSRTLAGAFHDDPVFRWAVPDPDRRRSRLPATFAAFADVYLPHGESYVAGVARDVAGAALWAPPGVDPFTSEQQAAFGERITAVLGGDADRAFEIEALLEEHHPTEACFYLQFMGVVPEQQGRGIGTGLLAAVLERGDATRTPAYLEATSPGNRRLYERHGFEAVGEVTLPGGPPLWPMWREPVARD